MRSLLFIFVFIVVKPDKEPIPPAPAPKKGLGDQKKSSNSVSYGSRPPAVPKQEISKGQATDKKISRKSSFWSKLDKIFYFRMLHLNLKFKFNHYVCSLSLWKIRLIICCAIFDT